MNVKRKREHKVLREFTRAGAALLNSTLNHDALFKSIGLLNLKWNFLKSVFVVYPATEQYARSFFYERHIKKMKWSPRIADLIRQNGKWGLGLAISSADEDFRDPQNHDNLRILVERTEHIRKLLGASQKTFAGILPGIMHSCGLMDQPVEADVTVEVVCKAETRVRLAVGYAEDVPVIVLGGSGFIGSRLTSRLSDREVYSVDVMPKGGDKWPSHITGRKAILINVASRTALREYLGLIWPGLVLLNEVYPEPSIQEREVFWKLGNPVYHVVGIKATAFPSLPKAYAGGIPCCAGWKSDGMEAVIRRLDA